MGGLLSTLKTGAGRALLLLSILSTLASLVLLSLHSFTAWMRKSTRLCLVQSILAKKPNRYPQRVSAALVLICSLRGFIGFGISYGAIAFVNAIGYEGSFNICTGIVGALMFIGIFVYVFGRHIRRRTQRFAVDH